MDRRRRTFGPLFYGTLVVAAIGLLIAGLARFEEWRDSEPRQARIRMEAAVAALDTGLANGNPGTRAASIHALGEAMLRQGIGLDMPEPRERILADLRGALKDPDDSVRAAAADMLGTLSLTARPAIGDLSNALNDQAQEVSIAAAGALIRVSSDDQSRAPAIRVLAGMVADPAPLPDRMALVNTLRSAGEPGEAVALQALVSLLANKDERVRLDAVRCLSALGSMTGRISQALQPLLKGDNPGVRATAAIAAVQDLTENQPPAHDLLAALEATVIDTSLSVELRTSAIEALQAVGPDPGGMAGGMAMGMASMMAAASAPAPGTPDSPGRSALRRCGLALARQLEHKDPAVRLAAANLLHMIDAETLAGKDETPPSP